MFIKKYFAAFTINVCRLTEPVLNQADTAGAFAFPSYITKGRLLRATRENWKRERKIERILTEKLQHVAARICWKKFHWKFCHVAFERNENFPLVIYFPMKNRKWKTGVMVVRRRRRTFVHKRHTTAAYVKKGKPRKREGEELMLWENRARNFLIDSRYFLPLNLVWDWNKLRYDWIRTLEWIIIIEFHHKKNIEEKS